MVRDVVVDLTRGKRTITIPLTAEQSARLARDGSALISFQTPDDEVQALDLPL